MQKFLNDFHAERAKEAMETMHAQMANNIPLAELTPEDRGWFLVDQTHPFFGLANEEVETIAGQLIALRAAKVYALEKWVQNMDDYLWEKPQP